MERKPLLQPEFNAGEAFLPLMASDEAFINGLYNGLSYQSVLSLSLDHYNHGEEVKPLSLSYFHPSLANDIPYAAAASQMQQSSATFDFSTTRDFPWLKETESILDADQKLKLPKLEPVTDNLQLYPYNNEIFLNEPPFNYFSNSISDDGGLGYGRLPDLRCLEMPNYLDFHLGDSSSTVNRVEPVNSQVLMSNQLTMPKSCKQSPYASSTTRIRRQKLSEKTRSLEKLLPWDKKMDTATMLGEAYKYVKFLQAQVRVLQSMPVLVEGGASSSSSGSEDRNAKSSYVNEVKANSFYGPLARLDRQQLLQVVLNSPVAQTYLYSKGCCVYSAEQLLQLRKIAQRSALYRQMLFYSGMFS
ncbi:transcription factor bHLH117-like [Nicotiana tomentosiformis]|uniref:transcription factor bHLH117-like n=1 Tax=Nicotiana tomentosiformis TaxID=4098 RepID=UPI00051C97E2|nr:transcription factor bHLH117-like [Nicotiana tomentosiformis]